MATPQTIDVDALLAPVSADSPTGTNLRADLSPDSVYYRLRDARNAARRAERADFEGEAAGLLPEWRTILDLAPKVLRERSKDLQIAAWLIEALVRRDGFAGLRDGFRLVRGFIEQYWDTLYSLEDEEGIKTKVAPLTGLNGEGGDGVLLTPIRRVPLTTAAGDDGPFAAYHYEQANRPNNAEGAVTLEQFTKAVNASGGPFYVELLADIRASLTELEDLGKILDQRAGQAAPSISAIRDAISSVLDIVQNVSRDLVAALLPPEAASVDTTNSGAAQSGNGTIMLSAGGLRNREEALDVLLKVAGYFERYEPHSPICTSIREIVRRAKLPFAELMKELLDPDAYRKVLTGAGIKPPDEHA